MTENTFTIQGRTGPWELVMGLEIHAQVASRAKLFSGAAVAEKPQAIGWFVGQIMKATGGKANPAAVNDILKAKLGL